MVNSSRFICTSSISFLFNISIPPISN
jgi:hypothetical protein